MDPALKTPRDFFTISRVIQMTGFPPDTLDMLQRELGDRLEVRRTSAGNRLFTPTDIANLKELKRLLDDEGRDLNEAREILFPNAVSSPANTLPGVGVADMIPDNQDSHGSGEPVDRLDDETVSLAADPDSLTGARLRVAVEPDARSPLPVEVRSHRDVGERTDVTADETFPGEEAAVEAKAGGADPVGEVPPGDVDRQEITVPPLPVGPTVDLLLEATEGLVQENLKLRKAIDTVAEHCLRLEEKLAHLRPRRGLFGLFRRRS